MAKTIEDKKNPPTLALRDISAECRQTIHTQAGARGWTGTKYVEGLAKVHADLRTVVMSGGPGADEIRAVLAKHNMEPQVI